MNESLSVIVRAYNAEKYICEALRSIIENTYSGPIETVVCYDLASKDRSLERIENFISNYGHLENRMIKLVKHDHTTPFRALNVGFSNASGSYVSILDYDNLYPKKHLETMVSTAKKTKNEFLFVTDRFFDDITKKTIGMSKIPADPCNLKNLIQGNYIDGNAILMNSDCLSIIAKKLSHINHRLYEMVHEDWLIAMLALKNCNCYYCDKSYVLYRKRKDNLTGIYNTDLRTNILTHLKNISTLIAFYEIEGYRLNNDEINILERSLFKNYLAITYFIGKGVPGLPLHSSIYNFINIYNKLKINL